MANKYTTILNDIKEKIGKRIYAPGDNIPTEIDMCSFYGVSRVTIQKAMKILIDEGYIYRIIGKGTFVKDDLSVNGEVSFVFVILPNKEYEYFSLIQGVEAELLKANFLYSLHFLDNPNLPDGCDKLDAVLSNLLNFKPKGFIVYPPDSSSGAQSFAKIREMGIPLVLLDKENNFVAVDCVVSDNYPGMYNLTQYVIDCGHKNIAYLSFKNECGDTLLKRENAFFHCMAANGIAINKRLIKNNISLFDDISDTVKQFVSENHSFTAIVCANDVLAHVCYRVFEKLKITIPDEISVCSFDGFETSVKLSPELTVMSQNLRNMAGIAVKLILKRPKLTGFSDANFQLKYVLPSDFSKGESVKKL